MNHLMIDLETMGQKSFAAIVSIGAVFFNMETGETGEEFHLKVDLKSSMDAGLKVDASTLYWWLGQSKEAREGITEGEKHELRLSLEMFTTWVKQNLPENVNIKSIFIWGNGSKFDLGLLENAYDVCGLEYPFAFWNERDVRTVVAIDPMVKKNMVFDGVAHDAVYDCKHQIKYCVEIAQHHGITFS